ncbi:YbhB/YbcL family Raf kinase inhibitor-like protein [uncultured Psychrosphaera sp.]|uniref:YbhB/YbcL family Raf kinase inhibitor-like protein n=1 Tax=uncultured Psychrosphaera sp. TaxID=1403522 RepID=UPI002601F777|nr:YbhB/YbcL family Raf kinase inhibitor-like protein [uncultured Psychrosphaera sp.]
MFKTIKLLSILLFVLSTPVMASSLTLISNDIAQDKFMDKNQEFNGFGCSGDDLSPHLKWSNAPKGTKSFAITAYDPDAPTGSGWWHWQIINIPTNVMEISAGIGSVNSKHLPKGSSQIQNDYGIEGFGGACPPQGHGQHRYRFTVHALSVEKLELPSNASGALTGYMINANTIESSTIQSLYERK